MPARKAADDYSDDELKKLFHNNHERAFAGYLGGSRHARNKERFLIEWVAPSATDYVLECGSSSGKTSISLARHSGCRCLGIDFDEKAITTASRLRDKHFPELHERCQFALGDLTSMRCDPQITKILMPDFTEHVPDRILGAILRNLASQLPQAELFIYTPSRSHVFEILKHRNIVLKNASGHINVKTRKELLSLLVESGWSVLESRSHTSSMWYAKAIEKVLLPLPIVGKYFDRRLAIRCRPSL